MRTLSEVAGPYPPHRLQGTKRRASPAGCFLRTGTSEPVNARTQQELEKRTWKSHWNYQGQFRSGGGGGVRPAVTQEVRSATPTAGTQSRRRPLAGARGSVAAGESAGSSSAGAPAAGRETFGFRELVACVPVLRSVCVRQAAWREQKPVVTVPAAGKPSAEPPGPRDTPGACAERDRSRGISPRQDLNQRGPATTTLREAPFPTKYSHSGDTHPCMGFVGWEAHSVHNRAEPSSGLLSPYIALERWKPCPLQQKQAEA